MNSLPPGANRDNRLVTVRRGVVKVNAQLDMAAVSLNKQRIQKRPGDALYTGAALTGELSNEQYKPFENDIAVILKNRALIGDQQRFEGGPGQVGAGSGSIRVPILYNANGMRGKCSADIDAQVEVLGFCDQVGRSTSNASLNVILQGLLTVANSGTDYIRSGDVVIACTPTLEEADKIKGPSGNLANYRGRNGRVPFILKPLRPERIDFLRRAAVLRVIHNEYEFIAAAAGVAAHFQLRGTGTLDKGNSFVEREFGTGVKKLVEALTGIFQVAPVLELYIAKPAATAAELNAKLMNKAEALTMAINFLTLSGPSFLTKDQDRPADFKGINANEATLKDAQAVAKVLHSHHPLNTLLQGLSTFIMLVMSKTVGRAVMSAAPGQDFDIFAGRGSR